MDYLSIATFAWCGLQSLVIWYISSEHEKLVLETSKRHHALWCLVVKLAHRSNVPYAETLKMINQYEDDVRKVVW